MKLLSFIMNGIVSNGSNDFVNRFLLVFEDVFFLFFCFVDNGEILLQAYFVEMCYCTLFAFIINFDQIVN